MSEPLFYIQDTRTVVGNCALWWRAEGQGYACDLKDAGKFTREEAERIERSRGTDRAFPCELIDANSVIHVRVERLRELVGP